MIDRDTYIRERAPRFGDRNPTRTDFAFWRHMVRTGESAYRGGQPHRAKRDSYYGPVWSFQRFGPTRTPLSDGRVVCIAGEHEDHYDPDFNIYNDVIVVSGDGGDVTIYGYPKDLFPPTDFHTATLCDGGEGIVIIGRLGYWKERAGGAPTPVYSLDLRTFKMRRHESRGESPGWIYKHRATLARDGLAIQVVAGTVIDGSAREEKHHANTRAFELDLTTLRWREIPVPPDPHAVPQIEWPQGWTPLREEDEASYLRNRLLDQAPLGHPLFAAHVRPWAEEERGRGVLFKVLDDTAVVAVVTLDDYTPGLGHSKLPEPTTVFYPDLDAWLRAAQSSAEHR